MAITSPSRNGRTQATPDREHPPASANPPVHEVRLGRIKGTVWMNETETGPRYNTTFARLYRVEDEWRETSSFGRDDLPLVAKVADQVHSWIFGQNGTTPSESAGTVPF